MSEDTPTYGGRRPQMTPADVERVAHGVRLQIQQATCCPRHATDVLLLVLAGFALDDAGDNAHQAAATLVKASKQLASRVRSGQLKVLRQQQ